MPTILDSLVLELGVDATAFRKGMQEVVSKTKETREDYERHAKSFEAVATGMFRALQPLIAAILGIGSAIEGIDWAKHAAAATTQFGNLAEIIGMSAERLSAWKQAAEAAAGSGEELAQAFAHQQEALKKMGPGGTGEVDVGLQQTLQHYGINQSAYYDARTHLYDIERMNRDIAAASARMGENAADRAVWLSKIGITNPGNQTLYQSREFLDDALKKQIEIGVITSKNVSVMKGLQQDFANVASAASNLGQAIVTNLADPLHTALVDLQKILTWLKDFEIPDWLKHTAVPPPTGFAPFITGPFGPRQGPSPTPVPPPGRMPSPGAGTGTTPWDPLGLREWWNSPPSNPTPAIPQAGAPFMGGSQQAPSSTPLPMVPWTGGATPGSFEDRWKGLGPQSSILGLPQYASNMAMESSTRGGRTVNSTNSVVVGGITIAGGGENSVDTAPSDSSKSLAMGSYAVHADEALL